MLAGGLDPTRLVRVIRRRPCTSIVAGGRPNSEFRAVSKGVAEESG